MTRTSLIVGMAIALGTAAALAQVSFAKDTGPADTPAAAAARGAKAWADNCATCHNNRSPLEKGDAGWAIATTHMRVRANISGDVARDIIAFLQASNDQQAPAAQVPAKTGPMAVATPASNLKPGDPEHGAQVFDETCVACHGADGKGAIDGVPPLSGPLTKPDEVLLRHMIEGFQSPGSPMPMPARGGNPDLTDQDINDVLAYLRKNFSK